MGVSLNALRFILEADKFGVSFNKTITIGHQNLRPNIDKVAEVLKETRGLTSDQASSVAKKISDLYIDKLLMFLGAQTTASMDVSDYESATIIHDMNQPIPQELKSSYDAVVDGGSLEHIFNFPTAVKNCMEMVKVGGHFIIMTPANNNCGHGFYQFSPELYFRILSEENGFQVVRMIFVEDSSKGWQTIGRWFDVIDPNDVQTRATLINDKPVQLFAIAKKISECEIFRTPPLQSYYVKVWEESQLMSENTPSLYSNITVKDRIYSIKSRFYGRLHRLVGPAIFKTLVNAKRKLVGPRIVSIFSIENKDHYKPIKIS